MFNNFNNYLSQGILKIYRGYNLKILQLQSDRKLFTGDLGEIKRMFVNLNPLVISTNDYSRQILVTHYRLEDIEEFKEIIEKNSEQYKIISIIKENKREIKILGLSIISFESAESLNNSLIKLFDILPKFLETPEQN